MADEHQKSCEAQATNVETTDRGMFDFLKKKEEEKPQIQENEVIVTDFEKIRVSEQQEDEFEKVRVPEQSEEEFEKVKVSEQIEESKEVDDGEKKPGLFEKLHRSNSSSSSSSDEEEDEEGGEKKKKKKKGLKETPKEKLTDDHKEHETLRERLADQKIEDEHEDTSVPIEKYHEVNQAPPQADVAHPEEKKGFLEKIKDKVPGLHKKPEEATGTTSPAPSPVVTSTQPSECAGEVHVQEAEPKEKKGIFEKIKEKLPGYHKNGVEEKKEETTGGH